MEQVYAVDMTLDTTWCGTTNPTRLALDRDNGLLYVTSPLDHSIVVYDLTGQVVNTIETAGPPAAICLAEAGHLLVSIGRSVHKITTAGEVVVTYGLTENYFVDPHDIARTPAGVVYIADDDDIVKVFDDAGAPVQSFGGYGYFPSTLDEPVAIDYHSGTNELIVNDQNNYRLKAFGANGTYLRQWGAEGSGYLHDAHYFRAFGMDIDEAGRIWTLDVLLSLFEVYDSSGVFCFRP
ncbi:MAG: NHL repeat-containing protein [bacterium]|nr:NHL repeat-containing protein [bacterium]